LCSSSKEQKAAAWRQWHSSVTNQVPAAVLGAQRFKEESHPPTLVRRTSGGGRRWRGWRWRWSAYKVFDLRLPQHLPQQIINLQFLRYPTLFPTPCRCPKLRDLRQLSN
jgi:hypothetical protein